jgi:Glycosyl hydrolases family 43
MHPLSLVVAGALALAASDDTWTADHGNGTYSNPLFYDAFSDADLIRVGEYFYLTGTTMHAMPGLPVLRSRDLVNWELVGYALDRLDLGPEYRLEGGDIYGQGIWAPSFRHHQGTFYIFSNVNRRKTQMLDGERLRRRDAAVALHAPLSAGRVRKRVPIRRPSGPEAGPEGRLVLHRPHCRGRFVDSGSPRPRPAQFQIT